MLIKFYAAFIKFLFKYIGQFLIQVFTEIMNDLVLLRRTAIVYIPWNHFLKNILENYL